MTTLHERSERSELIQPIMEHAMNIAIVVGTILSDGKPASGVHVELDINNIGFSSANPSTQTNAVGSYALVYLFKPGEQSRNVVVRQSVPAGLSQSIPPGNLGQHLPLNSVASTQYTADFTNITPAPPAKTPYSVGWCLEGVSGPGASVAQIIADTAPLGGCNAVNMWLETPTTQTVPDSQFNSTRAFNAEKIRSFLSCMNPQNTPAPNRTKYPADGGAAYFNSFPDAADIGNPVLILSDEHDNADYNTDTPENFAHMLSVACLILPKKGYTDLCLTWIRGMGWIQQPNVAAVIKANPVITRMGHHAMDSTAASSLAEHDAARTYVEKVIGRIYEITQSGLHNANWGVEVPALYSGLRSRGIPALAFSLYRGPLNAQGQTQQPACNCAPYISPGIKNPVIFDGMVKAIVGAT